MKGESQPQLPEPRPPDAASQCARPDETPLDMEQLVAEHLDAVYGYALRLSSSADVAEETAQQVFLIAQRRRHQIRDPQRARAWLLAVTRNCFFRRQRRRNPVNASDQGVQLEEVAEPVPDCVPIDRERLEQGLSQLPEPFRVVLVMFYYEQASYKEIAEALGVPAGTVMSRLARAKAHLRRFLCEADRRAMSLRERGSWAR